MKFRTLMWFTAMMLFAALAAPVCVEAQDQKQNHTVSRYTITTLGTLGGKQGSSAHGINNRSWVTGDANLPGDASEHATLWRDGEINDLGTIGGVNSNVNFPVKNDHRLIAGFSQTSTVDPLGEQFCIFICTNNGGFCQGSNLSCRGFRWRDGEMTPLATLGGNNSAATGANNRGQIIGTAENSTQDSNCISPQVLDYKAVVWGPGMDEMHELPTFPGDSVAVAAAINDKGQVVGVSGSCGQGPALGPIFTHAVLWQNSIPTDLGNLGGALNNVAFGINQRGQVVGMSDLPGDTTFHAFLWQKGIGITDLGTLPGDSSSSAGDINDEGQVPIQSCDASGNCRAAIWQNGVMTDLNALVLLDSPLFLVGAFSINSRGEIAGTAFDPSTGEMPAFLATPCNQRGMEDEGCKQNAEDAIAARAETAERPKIALPGSVREQFGQRPGFDLLGSAPR